MSGSPKQRTPAPAASGPIAFPDTRSSVLVAAAGGDWKWFLDQYLRPCWREVVIVCRSRQIPLDDAEDVYQDLMVRVLREANFSPQVQAEMARHHNATTYRGNLPARFLEYRQAGLPTAKFRTYLKRVIQNVVLEAVRKARRLPKQIPLSELEIAEPWIEQSVSVEVDRQWIAAALTEAACRLREECEQAHTRGRRRMLEVLYFSNVEGHPVGRIANRYGVDRTTVSALLSQARHRFLALLTECTGIRDPSELNRALGQQHEALTAALARAYSKSPLQGGNGPLELRS